MSASDTSSFPISAGSAEEGIDLVDILLSMLGQWKLWTIVFLVTLLAGLLITFSIQSEYQAVASFIPKDNRPGGASVTAFLTNNAGPGAVYVGMLKSRTVQEDVIRRANLLEAFHVNDIEGARGLLAMKSKFAEGADTLVTITIRDKDSQLAALIANAYLDALQALNESMSFAQSRQTAVLFESQLQEEREGLSAAETQLAQTQKSTGLIAPAQQTQIGLGTIAALRGQITTIEVQLAALLQGATEANPQVKLLRSQIEKLRSQEAQLEGSHTSPPGAAPGAEQLPQTNLNVARAEREVQYHATLVDTLGRELESARLNEVFSHAALLTVDRAVPPKSRSWPPRSSFVLASILFAAFVGLFAVIVKLAVRRIVLDPAYRAKFSAWRANL